MTSPAASSRLFESLPAGAAALRDNNFDALRLIFASMVVVFHVGLLSQAPALALATQVSATFAVQAFFVVSGFLVTMSFENSSSLVTYAKKRLRRILPAYVFVVVVAAFALSAMSTLAPADYFSHREFWRYLGFNLALSNFSAPGLPGVFQSNVESAVNGSLWTIKIEVAFYCVVPLLVLAVRRFGMARALATVFVASVLWKVGFGLAFANSGAEIYAKLAKQLPGQLSFFVGGAWAYYRTRAGAALPGWAAALGVLAYLFAGGTLLDVIAPLAVTAIVYWAAVSAPSLPRVGKHGDFSYGVYLYHFPLVQVFVAMGVFQWSPLAACLMLTLLVAAAAVVSWFLVEAPMLHAPAGRARLEPR
jgi:peptidoglycan/LPS O-acetylase OafA/YrhL